MVKTFVMLKPDAIQRNLSGEIIARLEKRGLKLVALKMLQISRELAEQHYAEHAGKPFFQSLVDFITSGPVIAMIWEGQNAVQLVRRMMGSTDPQNADPGTIRGDFALFMGNNVIHGSDSPGSAEREMALFFKAGELISYAKDQESWIYGRD